jgi:hypothetical protein
MLEAKGEGRKEGIEGRESRAGSKKLGVLVEAEQALARLVEGLTTKVESQKARPWQTYDLRHATLVNHPSPGPTLDLRLATCDLGLET